jgi:hypothetical protein
MVGIRRCRGFRGSIFFESWHRGSSKSGEKTERVFQTPIPNDAVDVFAVGEKFDTVHSVKSL